ncbi:transcription initiation factor TFIID subunit 4-like [Accipiter gentilis]|uniref:transcription initiation factor TFIID subunit 4-like n=1 Tax=Astur gentilis TaxID=8957 RepID=UPI00210F971F|nr:transcription initiation factor TFIID subunit 4-like [Accipiter gentilis]
MPARLPGTARLAGAGGGGGGSRGPPGSAAGSGRRAEQRGGSSCRPPGQSRKVVPPSQARRVNVASAAPGGPPPRRSALSRDRCLLASPRTGPVPPVGILPPPRAVGGSVGEERSLVEHASPGLRIIASTNSSSPAASQKTGCCPQLRVFSRASRNSARGQPPRRLSARTAAGSGEDGRGGEVAAGAGRAQPRDPHRALGAAPASPTRAAGGRSGGGQPRPPPPGRARGRAGLRRAPPLPPAPRGSGPPGLGRAPPRLPGARRGGGRAARRPAVRKRRPAALRGRGRGAGAAGAASPLPLPSQPRGPPPPGVLCSLPAPRCRAPAARLGSQVAAGPGEAPARAVRDGGPHGGRWEPRGEAVGIWVGDEPLRAPCEGAKRSAGVPLKKGGLSQTSPPPPPKGGRSVSTCLQRLERQVEVSFLV